MERNINNRDFEQFVKRNADQYRMYPSEKVWKGIYSSLHNRRKWYGIGAGLLLLSIVAVTWVMMSSPATKQLAVNIEKSNPDQVQIKKEVSPEQFINSTIQHNTKQEVLITDEDQAVSTESSEPVADNNEFPATVASPAANNNADLASLQSLKNDLPQKETIVQKPLNIVINDQATDNESELEKPIVNKSSSNNTSQATIYVKDIYPQTIESVVNSYKASAKSKKLSWQIFFTPTVSYRKLSENKTIAAASSNNPYSFASLYNVNNVVKHKPDMGIELGLLAGYPLTKSLKVIGGLQFNVSRYGIRAYTTYGEIATVALNRSYGVDSVSTWTNYRNFSGSNTNWLQNYYFSVSAPIGAEFKFIDNNKTQFGFAATLQPSLILGDRAYILSADYKNYVEIPWLIRRWNLNSSFEAFVNYSTGKIKWQVGPQVRYQLSSSFQNKYPVKENLFDFGLKVGIMLNK